MLIPLRHQGVSASKLILLEKVYRANVLKLLAAS
jgi:hypothetical protein